MTKLVNVELIKALNPCKDRLKNFIKHYNNRHFTKSQFMDLKNITQADKLWVAFRLMPKESIKLAAADIAESVLHLYEAQYPKDNRPRLAIEAARRGDKDAAAAYADAADAAAAAAAAGAAYAAAADAADAAYDYADAADAADAAYDYADAADAADAYADAADAAYAAAAAAAAANAAAAAYAAYAYADAADAANAASSSKQKQEKLILKIALKYWKGSL
jgi:hypothetical protein